VARRGGTGTMVPGDGVVHLAVPVDDAWTIRLDGADVPIRAGFGVTTAADITRAGSLTISYEPPLRRWLWVGLWAGLWLIAVAATMRPSTRTSRSGRVADAGRSPVIDLGGSHG